MTSNMWAFSYDECVDARMEMLTFLGMKDDAPRDTGGKNHFKALAVIDRSQRCLRTGCNSTPFISGTQEDCSTA